MKIVKKIKKKENGKKINEKTKMIKKINEKTKIRRTKK